MRLQSSPEQDLLTDLCEKPKLIASIEDRLKRDDRLGINIGLQEGLILKSLCSQSGIKKVVEIGTQYGCSASWMAMGLTGGKLFCFEKDSQAAQEARLTFRDQAFLELGCEVELFEGDALYGLSQIEDQGPFDLVFIDANKSGYLDYFHWAKKNVRQGGLIVADNVFLFGTMFLDECPAETPQKMWKVMKATLKDAFSDENLHSSLIPTVEGLLISCKKS